MKILSVNIVIILLMAVNCSEDVENEADTTIVLTDENFVENIKENSSFFVMFYAPW